MNHSNFWGKTSLAIRWWSCLLSATMEYENWDWICFFSLHLHVHSSSSILYRKKNHSPTYLICYNFKIFLKSLVELMMNSKRSWKNYKTIHFFRTRQLVVFFYVYKYTYIEFTNILYRYIMYVRVLVGSLQNHSPEKYWRCDKCVLKEFFFSNR